MKSRGNTIAATVAILALALSGAGQQSPEKLYQSGLYEEQVGGDLQKAIAIYQDLLRRFPDSREVAAKAQLHIGLCYEKLGTAEAEKAFRQVIDNYPEQSGAVRQAQEKLRTLARAQTSSAKNGGELTLRKIWSGDLDITARVSPDGRYLARTDWETGDLSILDTVTGKARRLTDKGPWTRSSECALTMAWSPDGRQIAYGWMKPPSDVEVRLVSVDDPKPRTVYRVDHPEIEGPFPMDWTPDGKAILINIEQVKGPRWFGAGGKIGLVSVADGSVRILKDLGSVDNWRGGTFGLEISPDGRWIAYSFQTGNPPNCDVFLLSIDGAEASVLVEHPAQDSFFGWAPDGKSILFSSDRTGALDAYVLRVRDGRADGQPELVKKDIGSIMPQGMAANGAFYYAAMKGAENVYVVRLDPGQGRILDQRPAPIAHIGSSSHSPAYSPDGRHLAFVSERGLQFKVQPVLCIRSLGSGRDRELDPKVDDLKQLRWSPDGATILFLSTSGDKRPQVCEINVETGEVATVFRCELANNRQGITSAEWSHDGKSVYCSVWDGQDKVSRLLSRDLGKGLDREIFRAPRGETRFGAVGSPDGKRLALLFRSFDPQLDNVLLKIMPAGGGEPRDLHAFDGATGVGPIVWTPDGTSILSAVTIGKDPGSLWRISADTGKAENLGLDMPVNRLSIHPDGRQIAVSSQGPVPQKPELWVMENFLPSAPAVPEKAASGPNVRQIWSGPDAGRAGRVSPDGKSVTLIDDVTGNLCVRDLVTGKISNVTSRPASENRFEFAGLSCWSPDGATLAYGWLNGGAAMDVRTVGIDGSHGRILYQKPGEFAVPMAWSPDGKLLAIELVRDSYTTFAIGVLSLEDGSLRVLKESRLLKTVPKNVVFSRDGRSVLVDLPQAADDPKHDIFAFALDGRPETRIVEHAANDAVLEWIPGSDALLFASDRTGTLDAWAIEVAGGLPKGEPRLVRRNLGDIMSLGFSRDGDYFYRLPVEMEDIAVASIDIERRALLESPKTLPQDVVGVSYSPQWSPDGTWLAYISIRREALGGRTSGILRVRSAETGQTLDVPMKTARFGRATWAPDGRSIFILASDEKLGQTLRRVDVQTGEAPVLVANTRTDVNMTAIAPAPDGRTVYYTVFEFGKKRSRIMALDLSTRESREIHQQEAPLNLSGLSLSADGKRLMFGTAEPDLSWVLKAIDLPDGAPREIVRAKTSAISASLHGSYCWTPAGDGVLFFKGDPAGKRRTWELFYAPAGDGEPRSLGLVLDGAPSSLSLHPDGHRLAIAVTREGGEVWVMENFLPRGRK